MIQKDFNSIKVRLELEVHKLTPKQTSFQFHKGAIRTLLSVLFPLLIPISIP